MKAQLIGVTIASLAIAAVLAYSGPRAADAQTTPTGGSSAGNEDPLEPTSGFDELTAEGNDTVGDASIKVVYIPGGCVDPSGMASTSVFAVEVVTTTASASEFTCADYGQTVIVQDVAVVFGTNGADVLDASRIPAGLHALVFGFDGDDVITPSDASFDNYIVAGAGADTLMEPAQQGTYGEFVFGGRGDDVLNGSSGPDFLIGGPGDDTVAGRIGSDELHGSDGGDAIDACPSDVGADLLVGGAGADRFDAPFLAEILVDSIFDYETDERVFDCESNLVAP